MSAPRRWFALGALTLVVVAAALIFWLVPDLLTPPASGEITGSFGSQTVAAEVIEILQEGESDQGGTPRPYQIVRVRVLSGQYAGVPIEMDYGLTQARPSEIKLKPGDRLIISLNQRPDGLLVAYFVDFVRVGPLLILLGVFVLAILWISGWKGFRSLLALGFSLVVIVAYIIPRLLSGADPVRVSIIGSALLLGVTLYLTYGWTLKTHAAVASMLLVLIITGTLAWLFVTITRLTGAGDENALFLLQMADAQINLRGLLLGGMLIGALGVLDDLVTTQASAVFELHAANPGLGFRALYASAMRIGQDHVAATVNTLVLAYAGTSLPMLLLFSLGSGSLAYLVNFSLVAEEIVRTLVGSLGLVAAVPITTALAAGLALHAHRLGRLRPWLGPENIGHDGHSHGNFSGPAA